MKSLSRGTAAAVWTLAAVLVAGTAWMIKGQSAQWAVYLAAALTVLFGVIAALSLAQLLLPSAELSVTPEEIDAESVFELQWRFKRKGHWVRSVHFILEEREIPMVPANEAGEKVVSSRVLLEADAPEALSGRIEAELPQAKETWARGRAAREDHTTQWSIRMETTCIGGLTARDRYDLP